MGKIVTIDGLNRYHQNLKEVLTGNLDDAKGYADSLATNYDAAGSASTAESNAKGYADSLATNYDAAGSAAQALSDAKADAASLYQLKGDYEAAGAAADALEDAKDYADGLATNYDAAGSASAAESNAKTHADGLNNEMDIRVKALEAIDHEKLANDASANAVAAIVAGADSDFDTLREVSDWILSDTTGAAGLQITVSGHTEDIKEINDELDTLGDLDAIRTGAELGATALQPEQLEYAGDGDIDGLFAESES